MLSRAKRIMRYAALLIKIGGATVFPHQLRRQIYSKVIFFGFEKHLDANSMMVSSRLPYSLQKASENDIEELLVKAKTESKQSVHDLVERKLFYESGFHDCYVARTDTGELCFVAWLVSKKDSSFLKHDFKNRLPGLDDDELLLENCYTFEKYRGNNIFPSAVVELCRLARGRGFKRLITYVRQDNTASLRAFEKLSLRKFEEIPEHKLFFFTKRKYN